jgi:O-antigen ligase
MYLLGVLLVGELVIRPVFALTLSDVFFLLAFAAVVVEGVVRGVPPRLALPWPFLLGALLFNVGGLISSHYSSHSRDSLLEVARLDYVLVVWLWLGPQILTTTSQLSFAIRLWTVSSAITGTGAVIQLVFGDVIPSTHIAAGRMTGFTQHVNDLGDLSAIALVPSLMFAAWPGARRRERAFGIAITVLILAGMILSGSVTGFVAAGFAICVWLVMTKPNPRSLLIPGTLVVASLGVLVLQAVHKGVSPVARLLEVFGGPGAQATGQTRLQVDLAALEAIRGHPFVGVGLDGASIINAAGDLVHNILIEVWLGAGLVGFLGLVLILAVVAWAAFGALRECKGGLLLIARALVASLAAFVTVGMAAPVLLSRYAWLPAAMTMVLRQLGSTDVNAADRSRLESCDQPSQQSANTTATQTPRETG